MPLVKNKKQQKALRYFKEYQMYHVQI